MKLIIFLSFSLVLLMEQILPSIASAQFPKKQLPIWIIPRPKKEIFNATEPLLVDVEIKNGLDHEVRMYSWTFEPNEWNGETSNIELPDIYRLPKIQEIWLKHPNVNAPTNLAAPGWYQIPTGKSKIKTIDVRKWEVVGGWVAGTYQITVLINKINIDEYSSVSVLSDPIKIEIR